MSTAAVQHLSSFRLDCNHIDERLTRQRCLWRDDILAGIGASAILIHLRHTDRRHHAVVLVRHVMAMRNQRHWCCRRRPVPLERFIHIVICSDAERPRRAHRVPPIALPRNPPIRNIILQLKRPRMVMEWMVVGGHRPFMHLTRVIAADTNLHQVLVVRKLDIIDGHCTVPTAREFLSLQHDVTLRIVARIPTGVRRATQRRKLTFFQLIGAL
mmetsp:Transcript_26700/g.43697  ORF Transcript_26700/g.43697 Transcript_26700/m.43697 type:complete len:213 (+) Transcript_26700:818-1456(+)